MAIGIEPCVAVKTGGLHDQLVSIPMPCRYAIPTRRQVGGPFEAGVQRDPVEPGVLFKQKRDCIVAMHDLNAVRRVDTSRHAERQTASCVVTVLLRIVCLPLRQTPLCVGEIVGLRLSFGVGQRLSFVRPIEWHQCRRIERVDASSACHVRSVLVIPMTTKVGLAISKTRGRPSRRQVCVGPTASSSATATTLPGARCGTSLSLFSLPGGESKIKR